MKADNGYGGQVIHLASGLLVVYCEEEDMSYRRKTKDVVELKLLEVTEDPAYLQDKKKTVRSQDMQADASSVVGMVKRQKTLH